MSESKGYGPSTPRGRWDGLCFNGDESRYEQWEVKVLAYLRLRKLKKIVVGEGDVDPAKNEEAFSEIVQFLDDRSLSLIMRDARDDGRKALEILRGHYAGSGKPRIISLYTVLTSLQKTRDDTMTDYVIRAENAANALKRAGEVISDGLLVAMIMKGLPNEYKSFVVVMTQTTNVLTFSDFKVALRSFEENEKASMVNNSNNNSDSSKIMQANFGRMNLNQNDSNKYYKKKVACFICGKEGHKAFNCWENQKNERSEKLWCSWCKSSTHSDKSCRRRMQNGDQAKQVRDEQLNSEAGHTFEFSFCCKDGEEEVDETEHFNIINTAKGEIVRNNSLLVDTGATSHIVTEDNFIDIDETYVPENHYIELADGTRTNSVAKKRGTVVVNVTDEDGVIRSAILERALYCPDYPQNIFSVRAATKKGAAVHFSKDHDELVSKDGVSFPIHRKGELYFLYHISTGVRDVKSCSLDTWHKILGHCNTSDILKLEGVVEGMKVTDKVDSHCSPCILGKQTQNKSKTPDARAKAPLEFVHSDVSGPIDPVAKDGYRYAITYTDDYSNAIFVYFLRNKDDATISLTKFIADSAPFGDLKRLRTDNGGEYISKEFKDILLTKSVKHEGSAPYCPHQNGTAERGFRTLFEMARCMLIDSGVPKYLWCYAVMVAVHIRNRCFSQRTCQTPYFLLTGSRPNLSKMNIFGTVCYAYIHGHKKKLEPRSKAGIFVGYEKNSSSFLVYYPDERQVKRHGMVTFTGIFQKDLQKPTQSGGCTDDFVVSGGDNVDEEDNLEENTDVNSETIINDNSVGEEGVDVDSVQPYVPENKEREPRKSTRVHQKPQYLKDYCKAVDHGEFFVDFCYKAAPKTYNEAIRSNEVDLWSEAMDEEIKSLKENNTYEIVELPEGKSSVGGRWVYALKQGSDGDDVYKARYVAKGYSQTLGIDYFSTFAPTARLSTIRMVIQIAVDCNYLIHQMDVKSAYLNAPIDCELYMDQPKGYEHNEDGKKLVFKLHKSIYGLKQSASNWNDVISDFFIENGCKQSKIEHCLYTKSSDDGKLIFVVWVDDIIVVADCDRMIKYGKDILKKRFKMKDMGVITKFLGINFTCHEGGVTMDQTQYLKNILSKFGMDTCKPRSTPCELKPSVYFNEGDQEIIDEPQYRAIVGSLIYAMTCTRADLSWVVTKLSQHLSRPVAGDWALLKQVLRYIRGTLEHKLHFTKSGGKLQLVGYSDSDWASSEEDRRSTTGYYFSLNSLGPAISWKSRKQPTVALSTCEAEYMALVETTQEGMYLKQVLADLPADVTVEPIQLFGDNQGSLATIRNPVKHNRTKHIDIKYHFIRDCYVNNIIDVQYVETEQNIADLMTKPMSRLKLEKFRKPLFGDH